MSVNGIEAVGFTPYVPPTLSTGAAGGAAGVGGVTTPSVSGVQSTSGPEFGNLVLDGLDRLDSLQKTSDGLAVQAATGTLTNLHDYTIAATQAAHLAYVRTGAPEVDATSRAGLKGLTEVLLQRTSADVGDPVGLSFFRFPLRDHEEAAAVDGLVHGFAVGCVLSHGRHSFDVCWFAGL